MGLGSAQTPGFLVLSYVGAAIDRYTAPVAHVNTLVDDLRRDSGDTREAKEQGVVDPVTSK